MSGGYPYAPVMTETLIGYARCSTDAQDLTAQRDRLRELGVLEERIYLDHGLTGTNRKRPGLDQALAAVRARRPCERQAARQAAETVRPAWPRIP